MKCEIVESLPKLDPMVGVIEDEIERVSIIDGSVEYVKMKILPPINDLAELASILGRGVYDE